MRHAGHPTLALAVHNAARSAFFDGFSTANLVAAGVAAAGAIMALAWLPAQPSVHPIDPGDPGLGSSETRTRLISSSDPVRIAAAAAIDMGAASAEGTRSRG